MLIKLKKYLNDIKVYLYETFAVLFSIAGLFFWFIKSKRNSEKILLNNTEDKTKLNTLDQSIVNDQIQLDTEEQKRKLLENKEEPKDVSDSNLINFYKSRK